MKGRSPAPVTLPDTMIEALHDDGVDSPAPCLEKRVYYKVISGASSVANGYPHTEASWYRSPCVHLNTYLS
jgi:hypothetical protein